MSSPSAPDEARASTGAPRAPSASYWMKVSATLRADGPAPVPADLAARALERARRAPVAPDFWWTLMALARPAAGVAAVAAILVVGATQFRSTAAPAAPDTERTLYAELTAQPPISDDWAGIATNHRREKEQR